MDMMDLRDAVYCRPLYGGIQFVHRMPNGYGASVVKHASSYGGGKGLWELAVVRWGGDEFAVVYDTPITGDVVGWLTINEVNKILDEIRNLKNQIEG